MMLNDILNKMSLQLSDLKLDLLGGISKIHVDNFNCHSECGYSQHFVHGRYDWHFVFKDALSLQKYDQTKLKAVRGLEIEIDRDLGNEHNEYLILELKKKLQNCNCTSLAQEMTGWWSETQIHNWFL